MILRKSKFRFRENYEYHEKARDVQLTKNLEQRKMYMTLTIVWHDVVLHLFRSPAYGFLVGAISAQGLQA